MLEKCILNELKKAVGENRGLQTRIAERLGIGRGTVSNRLSGARKSDESFRRTVADMAGVNYEKLVQDFVMLTNSKNQKNYGANSTFSQDGDINVNNNYDNRDSLSPEELTLIRLIRRNDTPAELLDELMALVLNKK